MPNMDSIYDDTIAVTCDEIVYLLVFISGLGLGLGLELGL